MGDSLSPQQIKHHQELQFLLKQNGCDVGRVRIRDLILEIDSKCPCYPEGSSLKHADWEKIGFKLHTKPKAPVQVLQTWHLCCAAIQKIASPLVYPPPVSMPIAPLLPPSYDQGEETKLSPTKNPPVPSTSPRSAFTLSLVQQIELTGSNFPVTMAQEASCSEDLKVETYANLSLICPVVATQDAQGQIIKIWDALPYPALKKVPVSESERIIKTLSTTDIK